MRLSTFVTASLFLSLCIFHHVLSTSESRFIPTNFNELELPPAQLPSGIHRRTLVAQEACAIPGPRGVRGIRGIQGDKGDTGETGLPGILGAQIEVIEVPYDPRFVHQPINTFSVVDTALLSTVVVPDIRGVLLSRPGSHVKVHAVATINIILECSPSPTTGLCDQWNGLVPFEYVATFTGGMEPTTISIPIDPVTATSGAQENVVLQSTYNFDSNSGEVGFLQVYLREPTEASVPNFGGFVTVTGSLVVTLFYQDRLTT